MGAGTARQHRTIARSTSFAAQHSGITVVDGVPINAPHFNENKPLRDQPPVTNPIEGAIAIQDAMELREWGPQSGQSPVPWVRYLREAPLPGVFPKPLVLFFGRGDQNAVNPGTSAILSAGNLVDRSVHYRHDLAFAENPTIPKNAHFFITSLLARTLWFARSHKARRGRSPHSSRPAGTLVIHPEPARFFEVPFVGPLPEVLNFIP